MRQGLADDYRVLLDTDTDAHGPADRRRPPQATSSRAARSSPCRTPGGTRILEPDAWPISQLTGFKVLSLGKKGNIRFDNDLPIFHGWEGKQFAGEGSALDFKDAQSAKNVSIGLAPTAADTVALARWEDGSVAVGMRKLGKGRVIVLGSTFWRNGRDLGGKGMWRTDQRRARVPPAAADRPGRPPHGRRLDARRLHPQGDHQERLAGVADRHEYDQPGHLKPTSALRFPQDPDRVGHERPGRRALHVRRRLGVDPRGRR